LVEFAGTVVGSCSVVVAFVFHFQKYFFDAAGTLSSLEQFRGRQNAKRIERGDSKGPAGWINGKGASKKLYG